jgi:hypothetical protein
VYESLSGIEKTRTPPLAFEGAAVYASRKMEAQERSHNNPPTSLSLIYLSTDNLGVF